MDEFIVICGFIATGMGFTLGAEASGAHSLLRAAICFFGAFLISGLASMALHRIKTGRK